MHYKTRYELVDTVYKDAIVALVGAVAGQKLPREPYSETIKDAAWNLVEAFTAGAVFKTSNWIVDENADDAITALIDTLVGENVVRGPYSDDVYRAAEKFVHAYRAGQEMQNCRITDLKEYEAEIERRRHIGMTIDFTTAETTLGWADLNDPYNMLDEKHHDGQSGRKYFARNPDGTWVVFEDLPEATRNALWKRDGRKLVFFEELSLDDDSVKSPLEAEFTRVLT